MKKKDNRLVKIIYRIKSVSNKFNLDIKNIPKKSESQNELDPTIVAVSLLFIEHAKKCPFHGSSVHLSQE